MKIYKYRNDDKEDFHMETHKVSYFKHACFKKAESLSTSAQNQII